MSDFGSGRDLINLPDETDDSYLDTGKVPDIGDGDSYMWNLDADLKIAMQRFLAAAGGRIEVISGFRSVEHQQRLWDAALEKYGDPEIADNWVARPGQSNHGEGQAMDLSFLDDETKEWAHANAARFGLEFPMGHEPWHIELLGHARGEQKTTPSRGAYTPRHGQTHPMDKKDPMSSYARMFSRKLAGQDPSVDPEATITESSSELQGETGVTNEGGMIHG
jgi:hypothetical protein